MDIYFVYLYWFILLGLTIFKTLLCCKADFFSSFLSQFCCLFFMDHFLTLQLLWSALSSLLTNTVMGDLRWKQLEEVGSFLPLTETSVNYWLCSFFFFFVLEYYFTVNHFQWSAPSMFSVFKVVRNLSCRTQKIIFLFSHFRSALCFTHFIIVQKYQAEL